MSIFNNTPEELPEICYTIVELIGYDKMLELIKNFDGEYVYFPKLESLTRADRNQSIMADFNTGKSYKELARKHNLSEVQIRNIVKEFLNNSK